VWSRLNWVWCHEAGYQFRRFAGSHSDKTWFNEEYEPQLSQIQSWGWSSCEDKCRWKKKFGQPFQQNWSLLELKFNSWFNNSCGTTTISTRLKSSRIEVQLKVQQLFVASQPNSWDFKSSTIASSTEGSTTLVALQPNPWDWSLLELQVQLKVQQLLWHHNQIHEIEVF
jgi:hypothetical protein